LDSRERESERERERERERDRDRDRDRDSHVYHIPDTASVGVTLPVIKNYGLKHHKYEPQIDDHVYRLLQITALVIVSSNS